MPSKGSAYYLLTIINDFSKSLGILLKITSDVFATFKEWKTINEKLTGKHVKCLRTDDGLGSFQMNSLASSSHK